jgi:ABC-type nitrate/sulfonate/bicarbonate transport system permease component
MRSASARLALDRRWTGFALVLLLVVTWELSVRLGAVRSESWPAVTRVLLSIIDGFRIGDWVTVFASTLYRMAAGFFLAVVLGIVVGLLLGASRFAYRTLIPTLACRHAARRRARSRGGQGRSGFDRAGAGDVHAQCGVAVVLRA